jgi:iron complex outermembrane receptor protein
VYSSTDTRIPPERRGQPVLHDFDLRKYAGEARLDYHPTDNTQLISTGGYSMIGSGREITTTFGAAQVKDWSYLNLQERLHHKQFFAQVFYDKSNSGNSSGTDPNGTYYLRSGIPVVDRSSILAGQAQQGMDFGRTRLVVGGEYLATRPQTEGTIDGRNESRDDINEYGGYVQTTTTLIPKLDFLAAARVDANSRIKGSQLSPRAALIFRPDSNNTFRLTFNRAYSSPTSFSFFLDQFSGQTPAPGMPVQILGNPPKEGWSFARSCSGGAAGGLCMRSPYIPGALAPASAAAAFPGFASQFKAIVQGLPATPKFTEASRQQLLGLLNQIGPILSSLRPSDAQVGTVLVDLNTSQPVSGVTDYAPLSADFANTWEAGYKGFIGNRVSFSVDAWFQRQPAQPTAQIINPGVLFNPQQLAAFLGNGIAQGLIAAGQSPAVAAATAQAAAAALTPLMAAIPVGATAFTNSLDDQPYLVFSYQKATGSINVNGIDLATDIILDRGWSVAATYSNLGKNVFPDAPGATAANPLAANTAKHRATTTVRYENQLRGWSAEVRGRYTDAFPVNSGVFNSYGLPLGSVRYPPVPVNALLDAGFSWVLPVAGSPRWSLNATNLLDNKVPTFVGVPAIGRLIMTRVQYQY